MNTDGEHSAADGSEHAETGSWTRVAAGSRLRATVSIATLLVLAALIWLDEETGPNLNISITYFVPITFAAWLVGRPLAVMIAFLATVPYAFDQIAVTKSGEQSVAVAVIDTIVRLMVFLFAAEVTYRLQRGNSEISGLARQLRTRGREIEQAYSLLNEDIRAAGAVQAAMTGTAHLNVAAIDIGARTSYARPVGGDLAMVGQIDSAVYACIADISGKGTPAALFTTLLRYLLDEALHRGMRGSEVIEHVNKALLQALPIDRFVTLLYVEIDPQTGSLQYVNAGHPEGLIHRFGTGLTEELRPTNEILGLKATTRVQVATNRLRPGDVLLLYTDGATDSRLPGGSHLGDEPIRELLKKHANLGAQALADAVVSEIEAMTVPESRDDLSVICIRKPTDYQPPDKVV